MRQQLTCKKPLIINHQTSVVLPLCQTGHVMKLVVVSPAPSRQGAIIAHPADGASQGHTAAGGYSACVLCTQWVRIPILGSWG